MFRFTTLENGLKVLTAPDPNARSMSTAIFMGVGSRFENEQESGISHFLEHMVFRGTQKYPDKLKLAKIVEGFGGEWNGGTSKEWTKYWIKAGAAHLGKSLDILSEMVFHPLLREEDIEIERGVIVEEINMYNDDPQTLVQRVIDEITWPDQPLGRFEAGSRETVRAMKRSDFVDFIKRSYTPENVIVGAAGLIDENAFISTVSEVLGELPKGSGSSFARVRENQETPRLRLLDKKTEQTHFCINFRGVSFVHPQRFAVDLLAVILGGGFCSRLFQKVREDLGLAYAISSSPLHFRDTGVIQIYAGVDNSRAEQAVESVLAEVARIRNGVTEEELTIAKERVKGTLALAIEDHASYLDWLAKQELLCGDVLTYDEWAERVTAVSSEEVQRAASEILVADHLNFALVGPVGGRSARLEDIVRSFT